MLKETVQQLDREIQKKRHTEMSEKQDAIVGLLASLNESINGLKPAIEESSNPMSYYQSGITTGQILKYGAGNLHGLVISGVINNSVITLYDNISASGTIIWSSGAIGSQTQPFDLEFHNLPFSTGLTLVISGANSNVLVAYE